MAHLVTPIDVDLDQALPVVEVLEQLQAAHQYLVQLGIEAQVANLNKPGRNWGSQQKRAKIVFPDGDRPLLIPYSHKEHPLSEIVNQCATMERMMSALAWISKAMKEYRLVRCHPTTSSSTKQHGAIPDNDIVLINPEGRFALFEVSDVIRRDRDGNEKESKDLKSLGIRLPTMTDYPEGKDPFINRLFLVVSEEFAFRLRDKRRGRKRIRKYHRYVEHHLSDPTCIFEVLPPA